MTETYIITIMSNRQTPIITQFETDSFSKADSYMRMLKDFNEIYSIGITKKEVSDESQK